MSQQSKNHRKGQSMDVKEIKKLIDLMVKNDLRELEIRDGEKQISLKRGVGELAPLVTTRIVEPSANNPQQLAKAEKDSSEEQMDKIVSPMVGTFYNAPNPESGAYVQVGETVTADSVVCIVEAMKVMNEIKAGIDGVIEKVLVASGEAVEFGQQMFIVRPT